MVQTVSTVWRSQLVFDLHSQGIRRLCGMYIIANPSLSSNTEKTSMCNNLGRQFIPPLKHRFAHLFVCDKYAMTDIDSCQFFYYTDLITTVEKWLC